MRHYSTEMVATYSEIQRLTQHLTSDAHLRQSEYEKIADNLAALNTTLAETKTVLHNFKLNQKTRTKTTKEIFIIISLLFSSLFISYESIRIFIYSIQ
ncbi:hypothetical protein AcetOrient_orf00040p (plasmid) [Acetobacter orientalis]|uniref:Uncharacterized protein n=1 Tax=Acetobacter orientalis TaxID=146474 RepID=A0A2Z5ZM68_9PROT|nr:hypothetical protein AcetOrient_orf00040p [Acetobacter orientalis]